jgi:TrwC relaxase
MIMVGPAASPCRREAAVLAVVVTIAKGYDLGYIWKTQDHAAGRAIGGYYINAAQEGEPPGRWWGPGARALGFAPGQVVEREPYDAVYQQIDPRTRARLGRPRRLYRRDGLVLQVDLGAARFDPGERAPCPPGR